MKVLRASLIAIALSAVSIGFGYAQFGVARATDDKHQPPAACARCGDGVCAKSCENAQTCPRDCGPVPVAE